MTLYNMEMTPDTADTLPRNTKIRGKVWGPCTWNNYTDDDLKMLKDFCLNECKDYRINQEIGNEGTPHLQFCMKFENARGFNALKKIFPKIHLEKSHNWMATLNYCAKAETAIAPTIRPDDNPYSHITDDEFVNENLELYWWQENISNLMEQPVDNRKIMWYWEPDGNVGKTSFIRHLCIKYPRQILMVTGRCKDITYALAEACKKKINYKLVIFHFVRSKEAYVSYEAIECVKDGIFFSTKYEAGMVIFNRPHIVCISNFEPAYNELSLDRWEVTRL